MRSEAGASGRRVRTKTCGRFAGQVINKGYFRVTWAACMVRALYEHLQPTEDARAPAQQCPLRVT